MEIEPAAIEIGSTNTNTNTNTSTSTSSTDMPKPRNSEGPGATSCAILDDLEQLHPDLAAKSAPDPFAAKTAMNSTEMALNTAVITIGGLPAATAVVVPEEKEENETSLEHDEIGLNPIEDVVVLENIMKDQNTHCCDTAVDKCLTNSVVPEDLVEHMLCRVDKTLCTCEVTDWMEKTTGYALCGDKDQVLVVDDDDDDVTAKSGDGSSTSSVRDNIEIMSKEKESKPNSLEHSMLTTSTAAIENEKPPVVEKPPKSKGFNLWKSKNGNKTTEKRIETVPKNEKKAQEEKDDSKCDVDPAVLPSVVNATTDDGNEADTKEIEIMGDTGEIVKEDPVNEDPAKEDSAPDNLGDEKTSRIETVPEKYDVEEEKGLQNQDEIDDTKSNIVLTNLPSVIDSSKFSNASLEEMSNLSRTAKTDGQNDRPESLKSSLKPLSKPQKMLSVDSIMKKAESNEEEEDESGFECVLQRIIGSEENQQANSQSNPSSLPAPATMTSEEELTTGRSIVTPSPEKRTKKSRMSRLGMLSKKMTFKRTPRGTKCDESSMVIEI
uniref:Uncharacterized protein n=1 Tax=Pseudo-nitzschia australis TaxID=44445 RepID=A0A7S4AFD5_9STRA